MQDTNSGPDISLLWMHQLVNAQWPEHSLTSLCICKLLWQFSYWCVNFWLFADRSSPIDAVELLSGIIYDINRAGGQEVFWYGRIFHQWFELVATASASFQYPLGLEANPNASSGRKVSLTNVSKGGRLRGKSEAMEEKESQSLRQ